MELTKFVFRGNLIAPTSYIKKIEKSKISLPASLHQEIRANYTQIKQRKGKKIKKYKLRKENIKTEKCKIENKQKKITNSMNPNAGSLRQSIKLKTSK